MYNKESRLRILSLLTIPALLLFFACNKEVKTLPPIVKTDTVTVIDSLNIKLIAMGPIRPTTAGSNPYVTQFFEYKAAPGQFINTSLGDADAAKGVLGNSQGLVSLGAWGGYVIYGFDHTVMNGSGYDIQVVGNAFTNFAEPGVVWVMQDQNGNGKPDDTWYEVQGSVTDGPGYVRDYSVTYTRPNPANGNVAWRDNLGHQGFVLTNMFHTQNYFPDTITDNSYTLTGTLLPIYNVDSSNNHYIISKPLPFGYCDNTPGGDSVDISRAIDADGRHVALKGIDFIKIQTGLQFNMGWLGEQSTEVSAVGDLSLMKKQ